MTVVVARITDLLGDECARGAFDALSPVWHFQIQRDCWPSFVEVSNGGLSFVALCSYNRTRR
jgi:hypothetical protein